ncbi:hypothetical protein MPSEU_000103700 [Mayamaea pseudoterrestris]|nr:hypothetical protein MPSEU_000103700 [Mayamaea pseudoterrestris]
MCGRAAQTYRAAAAAAHSFGVDDSWIEEFIPSNDHGHAQSSTSKTDVTQSEESVFDNFNMSPGMDAFVISKAGDGKIQVDRKTWGLVTRKGSRASPIPIGMNLHFSNLMFNARSDTLWEKPTFAKLAGQGKSCLIAVDGFFEWKSLVKGTKKQPYFVFRKQLEANDTESKRRPYLLMAGLWTSVSTGRDGEDDKDDSTLDTFTILTTDVCEPLKWLHTRMPLCIWDEKLALDWLENPTRSVHQRLEQACVATPEGAFDWHAVSPEMSSLKFRSRDAMKPMPAPTKITSFFQKKTDLTDNSKCSNTATNNTKHTMGSPPIAPSPPKKLCTSSSAAPSSTDSKAKPSVKKGPLDFFVKKEFT